MYKRPTDQSDNDSLSHNDMSSPTQIPLPPSPISYTPESPSPTPSIATTVEEPDAQIYARQWQRVAQHASMIAMSADLWEAPISQMLETFGRTSPSQPVTSLDEVLASVSVSHVANAIIPSELQPEIVFIPPPINPIPVPPPVDIIPLP